MLAAYVEREGHAFVPNTHIESGFKLGSWVGNRRQDYKSEKLAAEQVARLEALYGSTWDSRQSAWEEGLAALTAYVEREGRHALPTRPRRTRVQARELGLQPAPALQVREAGAGAGRAARGSSRLEVDGSRP
jgi:hypothetical protein